MASGVVAGDAGVSVGAAVATSVLASGAGTETETALEVSTVDLPSPVVSDRLWSPGGSAGGTMTNWPCGSAVASATVRPESRNSTFAFGGARPATTVSPVGATFTTSKAGFPLCGDSLAVGAAAAAAGAPAGAALGVSASATAVAEALWPEAGALAGARFGSEDSGGLAAAAPPAGAGSDVCADTTTGAESGHRKPG